VCWTHTPAFHTSTYLPYQPANPPIAVGPAGRTPWIDTDGLGRTTFTVDAPVGNLRTHLDSVPTVAFSYIAQAWTHIPLVHDPRPQASWTGPTGPLPSWTFLSCGLAVEQGHTLYPWDLGQPSFLFRCPDYLPFVVPNPQTPGRQDPYHPTFSWDRIGHSRHCPGSWCIWTSHIPPPDPLWTLPWWDI